ncbi:trypsin-like peptidase domain-containing protein [Actinosynnema sp. CA-299493]
MTLGDQIGFALVRVHNSGGVVGAGFLVAPTLVVTCAHVVAEDATAEAPPAGDVLVDFPLLTGTGPVVASVVGWQPVRPDGTGDVAVLGLHPPPGARPVPMAPRSADVWGHRVRVCGFPRGFEDGRWLSGVLRARQGTGWLQVEVDGPVRAGFSGAPVWDEDAAGVVGMLVARAGDGTAFVVPGGALGEWDDHLPAPFRGLSAFDEVDAPFFHGRDADTARLRAHVAEKDLVLVVGPSGSGKSSLVRAGLLPGLRADGVHVEVCKRLPGDLPDGRSLLFVDQFEELVDEDPGLARDLLRRLTGVLAEPGRRAVLTARSDSLDGLLTAGSARALEHAVMLVGPLDVEGLRAAVTRPVDAVGGTRFEDGLVERIVADAGREPGRLPLVEFALTELWERRRGGWLTHGSYDAIGGVSGALTRYADRALWLPTTGAKQILTRLARPDGAGGFVKTRIKVSEVGDPKILERLAATRLVVIGDGVVELAHQALVDRWDRLRGWLEADREFLAWRADLDQRLTQWEDAARDRRSLLGGLALDRALSWRGKRALSDAERDYIERSRVRSRRETWTGRSLTAVLAVIALLAGVFLVRSEAQRHELDERVRLSDASLLGEESLRLRDSQVPTALQLALAAWREHPAARNAHRAVLAQRQAWWSADRVLKRAGGHPAASADGGVLGLWDEKRRKVTVWWDDRSWEVPTDDVGAHAISPDGGLLALAAHRSEVLLWNLRDRTGPVPLPHRPDGGVERLRFAADGGSLTATAHRRLVAWDVASAAVVAETSWGAWDAVLLPDRGAFLAERFDEHDNGVEFDVAVRRVLVRDPAGTTLRDFGKGTVIVGQGEAVAECAPDGIRLHSPTSDEVRAAPVGGTGCRLGLLTMDDARDTTRRFIRLGDGEPDRRTYLHWPSGRTYTVRGPFGKRPVVVGALTPDGGFTAEVVHGDHSVRLRAPRPDPPVGVLGEVGAVVYHPGDGPHAVIAMDGVLRFVDASGSLTGELPLSRRLGQVGFSRDGGSLLISSDDTVKVHDTADLRLRHTIRPPDRRAPDPGPMTFAQVSEYEVAVGFDATITRWRLDTGRQVGVPIALGDNGQLHPRPGPDHVGQVVVEGGGGLEVWDTTTGRALGKLPVPVSGLRAGFVFDGTGKRIAALEPEGAGVQVWDLERREQVTRFPVVAEALPAFVDDTLVVQTPDGVQVWRGDELVADVELSAGVRRGVHVKDGVLRHLARHDRGAGRGVDAPWSLPLDPWDAFAALCRLQYRGFTPAELEMLPDRVDPRPPCHS